MRGSTVTHDARLHPRPSDTGASIKLTDPGPYEKAEHVQKGSRRALAEASRVDTYAELQRRRRLLGRKRTH